MKTHVKFVLISVLLISACYTLIAQEEEYAFYDRDKISVIKESFRSNLNGWILDNKWVEGTIQGGKFNIKCKNYRSSSGITYINVPIIEENKDFQIDVRYKIVNGAGGFVFGMGKNFDHYRIEFSKKKKAIYIIKDMVSQGKPLTIKEQSFPISSDTYYDVSIRRVGSRLLIYFNKSLLNEFKKYTFFGDAIGFSVALKSKLEVSNVDVYELPTKEYIFEQQKPHLVASDLRFKDDNFNDAIDKNEKCSFSFKIENNGRRTAKNVKVDITEKNRIKGIRFAEKNDRAILDLGTNATQTPTITERYNNSTIIIDSIPAETSGTLTFPVYGKDIDETGIAEFEISFVSTEGTAPEPLTRKVKVKKIDIKFAVEQFINERIDEWVQRGKFETTAEYKKRVSNANRRNKIEQYKSEIVNILARKHTEFKIGGNDYDPDNEVFKVSFQEHFDPIYFQIDRKSAMKLDSNFSKITFKHINYGLTSAEKFNISDAIITFPGADTVYYFDRSTPLTFRTYKVKNNFEDDIKLDLTGGIVAKEGSIEIDVGNDQYENIDEDIPLYDGPPKSNTFVLIIGNEDYKTFQTALTSESNVDFAVNDARTFYKYCHKTLGIPKENIRLKQNAISSTMKQDLMWLKTRAKFAPNKEDVELIFYYSGHGFPDDNKESYIMPVDISGANVVDGIKLSELYYDFKQLEMKRATFFLDACFSGGGRKQGLLAAKAVKIKPKYEQIEKGKLIVFSASSGDEESLFYREKQHGMFTYYLLKKIQETKGNLTYGDLYNYLKFEVPLKTTDIYNKVQQPEVNVSENLDDIWQTFKLR